MASPDIIKNAARWLVGYFSLIESRKTLKNVKWRLLIYFHQCHVGLRSKKCSHLNYIFSSPDVSLSPWTKMASPDIIKNAARWLVGYFSLIDVSEAWIMQFFYILCSQFRQKASSWIEKTLLLVKQQKWLSEFCGTNGLSINSMWQLSTI
jgi:hypothetical protein